MPTAILAQISNAISRSVDNYTIEKDYYKSPVQEALGIETGKEPSNHLWPFVRKDYLLDSGKLTDFPHNIDLSHARQRDLPVVFFYEVIALLQQFETEGFAQQCAEYYNKTLYKKSRPANNHARRIFFDTYAYLLSRKIIDFGISLQELQLDFKDLFKDFLLGKEDSFTGEQCEFYIKNNYEYYIRSLDGRIGAAERPFSGQVSPRRFQDENIKRSDNPYLYGPDFMIRIATMTFSYNSAKDKNIVLKINSIKKGQMSLDNIEKSEKEFKLEKGGCKETVVRFIYCMAAEYLLSKKYVLGDFLTTLQKASKQADQISNRSLAAESKEMLEKMIDKLNQEKNMSYRFAAYPKAEAINIDFIQAFIIDQPTESDTVNEQGSLHVLVPKGSKILDGIIELRFHFFDIDNNELAFTYIEAYSDYDEYKRLCDGYYFLPDREAKLPRSYPCCNVIAGASPTVDDKSIANVTVLLWD